MFKFLTLRPPPRGPIPHPCGNLGVNAKHLSINGRDYSGNLALEAIAGPQRWVVWSWVARFLGPEYPTLPNAGSVSIRADGAFDGGSCIAMGQFSISSAITLLRGHLTSRSFAGPGQQALPRRDRILQRRFASAV